VSAVRADDAEEEEEVAVRATARAPPEAVVGGENGPMETPRPAGAGALQAGVAAAAVAGVAVAGAAAAETAEEEGEGRERAMGAMASPREVNAPRQSVTPPLVLAPLPAARADGAWARSSAAAAAEPEERRRSALM
jgi:hypothetical protein